MFLAGSRGALVAGSLLITATVLLSIVLDIRAKRWSRLWRVVAVSIGLKLAVAGILFALPAAAKMRERVETGVAQVFRSFTEHSQNGERNYDNDMGARIIAAKAAMNAAKEHPLRGVGAGGFDAAALEYVRENNLKISEWRVTKLRTAHNVYLHTFATLGVVGLALVFAVLVFGLWGAAVEWRRQGERALGWYASSPFFALIGLAIVANFETLHTNMSSAAFVTILLALCGWVRVGEDVARSEQHAADYGSV